MDLGRCKMKIYITFILITGLSFLCFASCNNGNGQPIPDFIVNGDFETGDLTGWTSSGIDEGFALVVEEGSCFSANNTRGIAMKGIFATIVRSGALPLSSTGILTSDPFIAGNSIRFIALSENDDSLPDPNPVTLDVLVLDDTDDVLIFENIDTNVVTLSPSNFPEATCMIEDIRDGAFSTHMIDTSDFAGRIISIEFRQRTNVSGRGFFTLIDEVEVID
jgi:hypothetical protein